MELACRSETGGRRAGEEQDESPHRADRRDVPEPEASGRTRQPMTRGQLRWLVAILAGAAVLRVAWALYATRAPANPLAGDPFFYFRYGRALAEGHGYNNYFGGKPTAYYPIGYPAVLAVVFWVVQHTPIPDNLPMAGSLFQAAVGTGSVGLVFVISRRLFGTTTALVGAGIYAVFPNAIYYVATLQLETVFTFAFLGAVAVMVTHDWSLGLPSRGRMLVFGAVLGLSALVRPFSVPLLVGLVVTLLVAGSGWRRTLAAAGWAVLAFVVVIAPWILRNAVVMGAPTFSTNMGDTVCIDRYPHSNGRFRFVGPPYCAAADEPEARRNTDNLRKALTFVRQHPGDELTLVGKRGWYMMESDSDGLLYERPHPFFGHRLRTVLTRVANGYFFLMLALSVVGILAFVRERRPEHIFVLSAIVTLLGIPLVLWGSTRFHFPVLPFVAMAAASAPTGFGWLLGRSRRSRAAPGGGHVSPAAPTRGR